MMKFLKNQNLLSDGSVFKGLTVTPESILMTGEGRVMLHNWKGLTKIQLSYRKVQLDKNKIYVIAHNTYTGYFHWLLESLPRILIAKAHLSEFTLLLPITFTEDFYKDSLILLGIEASTAERLYPKTIYQVTNLGLPYLLDPMGSFTPSIVANLSKELLSSPALQTSGRPLPQSERLYISRKKANRRKVVNEQALEQMLAVHGFESICFEDYTLHEQIIICSQCRAIISIHGAGLSNILFMPAEAIVIELRKFDANLNHTYERLAIALGQTYQLVYCPANDESQLVQDADLIVNIAEIKNILRQRQL